MMGSKGKSVTGMSLTRTHVHAGQTTLIFGLNLFRLFLREGDRWGSSLFQSNPNKHFKTH